MKTQDKPKASIWRSLGIGAAIIAAVVIYAYGFQVTKVNLEETKSPRRQEQLLRIIRALAKPDLFVYAKEEQKINLSIQVPCSVAGEPGSTIDKTKPYLIMTPACAAPGEKVILEGFNMPSKS